MSVVAVAVFAPFFCLAAFVLGAARRVLAAVIAFGFIVFGFRFAFPFRVAARAPALRAFRRRSAIGPSASDGTSAPGAPTLRRRAAIPWPPRGDDPPGDVVQVTVDE